MSRQRHATVEFDPQVRLFHQAVLLHELNHRINNEFSSAISAVSLAAAHSGNEEVKMALSAVNELLHSYADVHRALQMPESRRIGRRSDLSSPTLPLDQPFQAESLGNTARACRLSFTVAVGSLLAIGNDRVRTHNQCCAPCVFWWKARDTRRVVAWRILCDLPGARQRSTAKERCSRTRAKDRP